MKNVNSYKVSNNLYINSLRVGSAPKKSAPTSINHIVVVDCSGSMYGQLDKLRAHVKAKVPTLVREGDTLSLVWFSGRGEFGPILEGASVATLRDLTKINTAIDRWLQPHGLTGFKEPLEEVTRMIGRIQKTNNNQFSLFFMSDGMDNQWNRADVLKTVETAAKGLVSSTFVEYGYYADRQMLSAMAAKAGGQLIHCDSFQDFEPALEQAITKQVNAGLRAEVGVPSHAVGGIVFEMTDGNELVTYDATSGTALVDTNTQHLWFLSTKPEGQEPPLTDTAWAAQYAALSLFAVRMKPDIIFPLLKSTGDVRFIKAFANCFGKQAYNTFMDAAKAAAFDSALRYQEGHNPALVPAEDAFTVFDLLKLLEQDDHTKLLLDDPAFDYSKISRAMLNADENLSAAEQDQVAKLIAAMAKEKNAAKLKTLQEQLTAITSKKREALKFTADPQPDGYDISSLTYNEESPNISVLVKKTGTVDIAPRRAELDKLGVLSNDNVVPPSNFPTFIYRNYAIVAHGIVNVKQLPVMVSDAVWKKLIENNVRFTGVLSSGETTSKAVIDLTSLPIINRQMVKSVTLADTAQLAFHLEAARASQKVFKDYVKTRYPGEKLVAFNAKYGTTAAQWLKDNGITEYSGFNPPKVQAESTDFIMGKELSIKLKGYSSLPPVEKVREKMAKQGAKLNGPETLMVSAIHEVEEFLAKNPEKLHKNWLTGKEKMNQAYVRSLSHQLSQIAFSIIVGQTWFSDCPTLDDKTVTLANGVIATAELKEVEIKL